MTDRDLFDDLRAKLDTALIGRDGWSEFQQTWTSSTFSAPGQIHTARRLDVRPAGGLPGMVTPPIVYAQKDNAWGQPCDVQELADVAEAIAWVETPRSDQPEQHRAYMAQLDADANRPKPQDVACPTCGAEIGRPCVTRTGRSLGDGVHARRKTAWKQARASRVVQTVRLPDGDAEAAR